MAVESLSDPNRQEVFFTRLRGMVRHELAGDRGHPKRIELSDKKAQTLALILTQQVVDFARKYSPEAEEIMKVYQTVWATMRFKIPNIASSELDQCIEKLFYFLARGKTVEDTGPVAPDLEDQISEKLRAGMEQQTLEKPLASRPAPTICKVAQPRELAQNIAELLAPTQSPSNDVEIIERACALAYNAIKSATGGRPPLFLKELDEFMSWFLYFLSYPQNVSKEAAAIEELQDGARTDVSSVEPGQRSAGGRERRVQPKNPNDAEIRAWSEMSADGGFPDLEPAGILVYYLEMKARRRRITRYELVCGTEHWREDPKEREIRYFGALSLYYYYQAKSKKRPEGDETLPRLQTVVESLGGSVH